MEKSITITRTVDRPLEVVIGLLESDARSVLSSATETATEAANDVVIHLEGAWRWFDVDETVTAELGELEKTRSSARLPVGWKADKNKRLLPSLDGHLGVYSLSAKHSELSYTATYAPPLGLFGGVEDFVLGRRILEAVLGRFLAEIVHHIEALVPED